MEKSHEYLLLYHCAPTLYGIKAANLFSMQNISDENLPPIFNTYFHILNPANLKVKVLLNRNNNTLFYVYNENMLKAKLLAPKIQKFLKNFGYKNFKNTDGVLEHLQKRISEVDGFPHEIGIFLDYPLRDVKGFIIHKGKNFLASGCWKVYVNKNEALRRFENYEQCRRDACKKFDQGLSVSDILSIA